MGCELIPRAFFFLSDLSELRVNFFFLSHAKLAKVAKKTAS